MTIEIAPYAGEWEQLQDLINLAFSAPWTEAQLKTEEQVWARERSLVAVDGKELVGHTGSFRFEFTVPGGQVAAGGVTMVGVVSTHRRRGILRDLMRRQLTDLYEAGEPLAVLTASEPVIYGRFGYGLASDHQRVTIKRVSRQLREVAGAGDVRIRFADPQESLRQTTAFHNAEALTRPGMFQHGEKLQYYATHDNVTTDLTGASPLRCVLAERDGELVGYTHYRTRRTDRGFVDVVRVHSRDVAAHAALWQFLLDPDLLSETTYGSLPSDDPLLFLLVDPRAADATTVDGVWARLTDVQQALSARTYAEELDVVLGVEDDFLPWNAGSWHLTGGPDGAACEKTDRAPDVVLGVRDLGTAYLGRPSLGLLGAAGLVEERTDGALAATSRAFLSARVPWLDTGF
ncbi:GNAT family N-acetyltransferase [Kribbella sp. CA-293567]|uniref:GNAT family N-acetyltransferase n=1 Tax=Kribbella sp. CA-293567 TaxID=3002436 RepID=UPI0022DE780C|nr:GNAT family N-acetyltransferase [Kribbella sp. CA-293567]WBQ04065.1 GNAT family N-acetyltransferase [Kribbella sp. CA-293567]